MTNWIQSFTFVIALLLTHYGVARIRFGPSNSFARASAFSGIIFLASGSALFFWDFAGSRHILETLELSPVVARPSSDLSGLDAETLSRRMEISEKLARATFRSGGDIINVVTETGASVPFCPDTNDLEARDHQRDLNAEIQLRRNELSDRSESAREESILWLVSLFISVFSGLLAKPVARP